MKQADDLATRRHVDRKSLIALSREVVQTADDAREIAVKKIDADRVNADRDAAAAQVADATAKSNADMQARKNAEAASADADRRRAEAIQATATAQQNNRMPKRNRIAIELPPRTPIKPPRMPSRAKETPKRNRIETELPLRPRISNSSKRCAIVKNFAPDCCNNSTPFLPLATLLVVSS